jgi:hypothetical protein
LRHQRNIIIIPSDDFSIQFMNPTTTTMMLVSTNKKAPSKHAADRDSSSMLSSARGEQMRSTISTPPPLENSMMMQSTCSPPSSGEMRRPLTSPPPLPKRCKLVVVSQGGHAGFNSSVLDQETPASAKSVLIELNSGLSILNNTNKSADAPPPRLFALSFPTQEPQEKGSNVGSVIGGNAPILSFDTLYDDEGDDAELASYFPRIRLQMRPRRRFVSMHHAGFIPIQDDPCDDASEEDE